MALPANQINVPSDAPAERFLTPNESPTFYTGSKDVTVGGGGNPVSNSGDTTFGGQGKPINT